MSNANRKNDDLGNLFGITVGTTAVADLEKIKENQAAILKEQELANEKQETHLRLLKDEARERRKEQIVNMISEIEKNGWDIHYELYEKLKEVSIKKSQPISKLVVDIQTKIDQLDLRFLKPSCENAQEYENLIPEDLAHGIWLTDPINSKGFVGSDWNGRDDFIRKIGITLLLTGETRDFKTVINEMVVNYQKLSAETEANEKIANENAMAIYHKAQTQMIAFEKMYLAPALVVSWFCLKGYPKYIDKGDGIDNFISGLFMPLGAIFGGSGLVNAFGGILLVAVLCLNSMAVVEIDSNRGVRMIQSLIIAVFATFALFPSFSIAFPLGVFATSCLISFLTWNPFKSR